MGIWAEELWRNIALELQKSQNQRGTSYCRRRSSPECKNRWLKMITSPDNQEYMISEAFWHHLFAFVLFYAYAAELQDLGNAHQMRK